MLRWRSRRSSDKVQEKTSALNFVPSIGEMDEHERRTPTTGFEPDDRKRLKRFRRMLLDDDKKDTVLNVNGVRVPVHHEVLVASSPILARLGHNISITDSSVEAVRHFVRYLHGVDVFRDGDLSVEEALELANLFLKFDIGTAATQAAHYCLHKFKPEYLNKFCRVLQNIKGIRKELAEKVAVYHDSVDLNLVAMSTMHLVLTSLRLTEIQKLVTVGKWVKFNSKDIEMQQLFGTVDLEYAGQTVKRINERLMNKNWKINAFEEKLTAEEEQKEALLGQLKKGTETINALTIALNEKEKEIIALQSSHQVELRRLKLALSARGSSDSSEPRQSLKGKSSLYRTMQAQENKTSTRDINTLKSPSIRPKKRMVEAEVGKNMPSAVVVVPSEKAIECPETNEVTTRPIIADESGVTHSLFKVYEEEVTKNSSRKNALGKEIFYACTNPHCYKVVSSSSSEDNDSDFAQHEREGKFDLASYDNANIEVSKPQ